MRCHEKLGIKKIYKLNRQYNNNCYVTHHYMYSYLVCDNVYNNILKRLINFFQSQMYFLYNENMFKSNQRFKKKCDLNVCVPTFYLAHQLSAYKLQCVTCEC